MHMHKLLQSGVEEGENKWKEVNLAFFSTDLKRVKPLSKAANTGVALVECGVLSKL